MCWIGADCLPPDEGTNQVQRMVMARQVPKG
jgi:hypothetical protein